MALARLHALPIPIKLLLIGLAILVVMSLAPRLAGLLGIAAVVLWALAAVGLIYAAGLLPDALRKSAIGELARALVLDARAPGQPVTPAGGGTPAPRAEADNRRAAAAGAESELRAMRGDDPARAEILSQILPRATALRGKGRRLLGAARALVFLVSGPPGVGKSTVGRALAALLYGLETLATPKRVDVQAPSAGRLDADWRDKFLDGLDGVVLIDNANWLAESNPLMGVVNADVLFAALVEVGDRFPGRLTVIVTLGDRALAQIAGNANLREVERRLTLRHLAMDPIPTDALIELLREALRAADVAMPAELDGVARRLVRSLAETDGDAFDYAEAMRRAAERIEELAAAAGRKEATRDDLEAVLAG
jgi:hypothetical protein